MVVVKGVCGYSSTGPMTFSIRRPNIKIIKINDIQENSTAPNVVLLSVIKLSIFFIVVLNVITLSVIMLGVVLFCYAEIHYAKFLCMKCIKPSIIWRQNIWPNDNHLDDEEEKFNAVDTWRHHDALVVSLPAVKKISI